jgi:hypothetical protein
MDFIRCFAYGITEPVTVSIMGQDVTFTPETPQIDVKPLADEPEKTPEA